MLVFKSDRYFKFWEYIISHGSLLLRSPATNGYDTNIDVIVKGMEYISIPYSFDGIEIHEFHMSEIAGENTPLRKDRDCFRFPDVHRVYKIFSEGFEYRIIASMLAVSEHDRPIMYSPFKIEND